MHLVRAAAPCVALRNYVRAYLQRQIQGCPDPVVEPVHARLEPVLHFNLGGPVYLRKNESEIGRVYPASVVGHQTRRRFDLLMFEGTEAFAVFFEPTRLAQLFRTPARYLVDQELEAGSVLGDSIDALRTRIGEAETFEDRVCIVEDFLLRQVARCRGRSRFALAADHVFAARGLVRISDLAQQIGLSQRQFERRFAAETGCSPKLYARVARFQTALDMKIAVPRRSWMEIAHTLYYHDQMHMVHDFRTLTGTSPDRFMAELGEARPKAVVTVSDLDASGKALERTTVVQSR
jgi:AraC-like DNA-binding protein